MPAISLPARSDRAAAEVLLPEFVRLSGAASIEIDGSHVEQVGQAMLQLLLSARRSGRGITIRASPAIVEAALLTGLSDELLGEQR